MITPTLTLLIANTRALAFIVNDDSISDDDITQRLSEALSSLYDLEVGAYEHYAIKQFSFPLAGGVGGNAVPLPDDFYKDNSLDRSNGANSKPNTVHRFEWLDRNRTPSREYSLLGNNLIVNPPQLAQGNYVLYYTPLVDSFALPLFPPSGEATSNATPVTRPMPLRGQVGQFASNDWTFNNGFLTARLATTAPLPTYTYDGTGIAHLFSSTPGLTIDGIAPAVNDLVLIKDEVSPNDVHNGYYVCVENDPGGWRLNRVADYSAAADINQGDVFSITDGAVNTGLQFAVTSASNVPDSLPVLFAQTIVPVVNLFSANDIGSQLLSSGCTNQANNGSHTITAFNNATRTITTNGTVVFENLTAGMPAIAISIQNLVLNASTSALQMVGAVGAVGDKVTANGVEYKITAVDDVFSTRTLTPTPPNAIAATVEINPAGTVFTLPAVFRPWYEYVQVHAAIACRDSIDLPTEAQERKLAALTKRIEAMAANRMEEPGQVALTHRSDGSLNDGGFYGF